MLRIGTPIIARLETHRPRPKRQIFLPFQPGSALPLSVVSARPGSGCLRTFTLVSPVQVLRCWGTHGPIGCSSYTLPEVRWLILRYGPLLVLDGTWGWLASSCLPRRGNLVSRGIRTQGGFWVRFGNLAYSCDGFGLERKGILVRMNPCDPFGPVQHHRITNRAS
jgi:hypothetical protein